MLETSARLLRLLSLLQTPRDWSGPQLAERLGVSTRTIRTDMERLRTLGYPVESTPGAAGGYRLGAGAQMPPLLLDDEEAVAVAIGLRTVAGAGIEGVEETSLRALTKLEQVLPSRLRHRVTSLHSATVRMTWGAQGPLVDPDTLTVLAAGIRAAERVRFGYAAPGRPAARRHLEPNRLVTAGRRWYLVGWDLDRDDWRTFRVDRISEPKTTGARFTPRRLPAEDAAAYVQQGFEAWFSGVEAEVLLHAPLDVAAAQVPQALGTLEALDDDRCLLRTTADSLEWLALRIAMLGFEFEVRAPAELADLLRTMATRMQRAADPS